LVERTIDGFNAGDVIRAERVIIGDVLIVGVHYGAPHRRVRQAQRMSELVGSHRIQTHLPVFGSVGDPVLVVVEVGVSADAAAGEEGVRQKTSLTVELVTVVMVTRVERNANVGIVGIDFGERQRRCSLPEVEGPTDLIAHVSVVQVTCSLSQTAT